MEENQLPEAIISILEGDILVIKFLDKDGNHSPWIGKLLTKEPIKGITEPGELQFQSNNVEDKKDDPIVFYMENIYKEAPHKKSSKELQLQLQYEVWRKRTNKEENLMLWRNFIPFQDCEVSLKPGVAPFKADILIRRIQKGIFGIDIAKK